MYGRRLLDDSVMKSKRAFLPSAFVGERPFPPEQLRQSIEDAFADS
jgi:hypothetical protein